MLELVPVSAALLKIELMTRSAERLHYNEAPYMSGVTYASAYSAC